MSEYVFTEHAESEKQGTEIFCLRFSPDSQYCATGCGDGSIRVFQTSDASEVYRLETHDKASREPPLPVTCLRFRPSGVAKTKNMILCSSGEGKVEHYHMSSSKLVNQTIEPDNQVYALDYHPSGTQYVTAGRDGKLRLYDEATKENISTHHGGHGNITSGHSNRVFSVKFHPVEEHLAISGGWDNTIQFWDMRVDYAIRSIFGVHICGDALDMFDNTILSGSWRGEEQLQMWDFRKGELIQNVHMPIGSEGETFVYSTRFHKDGYLFAAGGSRSCEGRIFTRDGECVGTIYGFDNSIYSVDFSPNGQYVAFAGSDGILNIHDISGGPIIAQ